MRVTATNRSRHHRRASRTAFTLIELLVIISIVALLMAVLLPTLQRVRRQTRAVVCQANLRQWGTFLATYVSENDGRLFGAPAKDKNHGGWLGGGLGWGRGPGWDPGTDDKSKNIRCCPMATNPADPKGTTGRDLQGGTFLAWGRFWPEGGQPPGYVSYGSYGANNSVVNQGYNPDDEMRIKTWRTPDVPGTDRIPVYFDHS